jgi:hypothetical protein
MPRRPAPSAALPPAAGDPRRLPDRPRRRWRRRCDPEPACRARLSTWPPSGRPPRLGPSDPRHQSPQGSRRPRAGRSPTTPEQTRDRAGDAARRGSRSLHGEGSVEAPASRRRGLRSSGRDSARCFLASKPRGSRHESRRARIDRRCRCSGASPARVPAVRRNCGSPRSRPRARRCAANCRRTSAHRGGGAAPRHQGGGGRVRGSSRA